MPAYPSGHVVSSGYAGDAALFISEYCQRQVANAHYCCATDYRSFIDLVTDVLK
jgi:hypothetical protein